MSEWHPVRAWTRFQGPAYHAGHGRVPGLWQGEPGRLPVLRLLHGAARPTAAPITEERKVVSVLFCDLVGFTASSDEADPEDVRAGCARYHARLRQEIERFGGTVEKFVGDAVMAVFGAPVAHEDDAERAVRAGLRILEAIDELNEERRRLGLQVRIGINTGEAVVALGATPEQGEGMVTGDVVNTALALQSAAPVDGVAVGEPTYRATQRGVRLRGSWSRSRSRARPSRSRSGGPGRLAPASAPT